MAGKQNLVNKCNLVIYSDINICKKYCNSKYRSTYLMILGNFYILFNMNVLHNTFKCNRDFYKIQIHQIKITFLLYTTYHIYFKEFKNLINKKYCVHEIESCIKRVKNEKQLFSIN